MKVGEALKVTRNDIQDFPGDTISIIMDLQKEGWRAQRSNRSHVMLLAPDGVTKYSASRNANSAKYLAEDIARYKRGEKMKGESETSVEEHKHRLFPYGDNGKYRCSICGGNTFTEGDLEVSANPKIPCPVSDCNRFYVSQEKVNVHVAVDHEGYLKCPDCDEVRDTKQKLSLHRTSKHGYESPRRKRRKELEAEKVKAREEVLAATTEGSQNVVANETKFDEKFLEDHLRSYDGRPVLDIRDLRNLVPNDFPRLRGLVESDVDPEVVRTEDMEFIDSRDSWVIDHHNIIDRRIGTLEQILDAAGLRMEIRVWKPKNS